MIKFRNHWRYQSYNKKKNEIILYTFPLLTVLTKPVWEETSGEALSAGAQSDIPEACSSRSSSAVALAVL